MELCFEALKQIPGIPDLSKIELTNIVNNHQQHDNVNNGSVFISEPTMDCIIDSLLNYTCETDIFLSYLSDLNYENPNYSNMIDSIYKNSFNICLNQLVNCADNHACLQTFYVLLCKTVVIDRDTIQTVCTLMKGKTVSKELVYYCLLVNKNRACLEKLIENEKENLHCEIVDPNSLFEFVVHKNKHWFLEVIEDVGNKFDLKFYQLDILRLLYIANFKNEFSLLRSCISNISIEELPADLKCFTNEIQRIVTITDFCKLSSSVHEDQIYSYASSNNSLSTLLKFSKLNLRKDWNKIIELLKMDQSECAIEIFDSFCILYNILECLKLCKNPVDSANDRITQLLNDVREKLLKLTDTNLQLELLENIYVLMFLRFNHLVSLDEYNHNIKEKFLCGEKEIRLIVFFVKSCLDLMSKGFSFKRERLFVLQKHISDSIWRLELISETVGPLKSYMDNNEFMNFMLASPKNLVDLCLKNGNFTKAHQVVQIFEMNEDDLASETQFMEDFVQLKDDIRKIFKIKQIQRETPNIQMQCDLCVPSTLKKFELYLYSQLQSQSEEENTDSVENLKNIVDAKMFATVLDLLITEPKHYEDCLEMLDVLESYKTASVEKNIIFIDFYNNVHEVFKIVSQSRKISFSQILNSSLYDLNVFQFKKKIEKHNSIVKTLEGILLQVRFESEDMPYYEKVSPKTFSQLGELCQNYTENDKDRVNVFQRLLNYLKMFSQIFIVNNECSKHIPKDTTCFTVLNCDRTTVIGKLVYEQNIEPIFFEQLFNKMKLDLIYHITANSFPLIELSKGNPCGVINFKYIPTKDIIAYVQKRNWLLAYLLMQIHSPADVNFELNAQRTKCFENLLNLKKTQHLKELYNNNATLAAIQHNIDPKFFLEFYKNILELQESGDSHQWNEDSEAMTNSGILETGEEILEDDIKISKWKRLYCIMDSLPKTTLENSDVIKAYDEALKNIITECYEADYYKYVEHIKDSELRIQIIMDNFYNWPGEFCIDVLRSVISMENKTSDEVKADLQNWCNKIEVYENIRHYTDCISWNEIHNLCLKTPESVLQILLNLNDQIDLLLDFIKIHPLSNEMLLSTDTSYFLAVFNANCKLTSIEKLLNILPTDQSLNICQQLLKSLQKIDHLQFIIDRLIVHSSIDKIHLKNIELSLKMISCFAETEQGLLLPLIGRPLNIIEQLLMNTKLEKLGQIISTAQEFFENLNEEEEYNISVNDVDSLLRKYAEKSLDFRVITEPMPILRAESKLLQSFDSLSLGSDKQPFIIPSEVPTKLEWVQNDEALECMCCRTVTFSMFNRRHHCRRCGRLICGNCSSKRMQVPTYGDILVRVCNQCYEQSHQSIGTSSTKSDTISILYDNWMFTNDSTHNDIVREEFSYEHAPSVSLCLAILKYHSNTEECPKFLLNQCDKMLKLIQPVHSETHHEIDYSLVIKMIKSLAIAAKMISLQCSAKWAIGHSDRILSQIELLNLLTEKGCLELIPTNTTSKGLHIDSGVLRKLRDKLLEREQWSLALEVSTKAGLDRGGVFAAWGKNCLKAGCFNLAREKFQKCFEKGHRFEISENSEVEDSMDSTQRSRYQSKISNLSSVSENRPLKTPPLIDDIIEILESKHCVLDEKVLKLHQSQNILTKTTSTISLQQSLNVPLHSDPAICIFNKLKNLSSIAAGNYDTYPSADNCSKEANINDCYIEPLFYNECIYYLTKYGSHSSILKFYIKHGEMNDCLIHVLDNRLSTDIFVEVYMTCLEDGIVEMLQMQMSKIDSSLDIWKNYLKGICRHMEKQGLLNSLYQLQIFMGDYVRAAMTCIRFYNDGANNYGELLNRVNFLHRAQEHLKQDLEQEQWVEVATVRKQSTTSQEILESFQEKSLTQSSLAMKVDARSIDKHINTIWRQIEVTRILAEYETSNQLTPTCLQEILKIGARDDIFTNSKAPLPTLFGSQFEKIQIAILLIICGKNVDDSFGVAFRIIQDYQLKPVSVYCQAGKYLAKTENYNGIAQLVSCVKSSGVSDTVVTEMCDEMLILAIHTLTQANSTGPQLDGLIKLITDKAAKISAYIESKQLKSAYLLAVKHKRMGDIRRILKEAESMNQQNIKALCQKLLQTHSNLPAHSRE